MKVIDLEQGPDGVYAPSGKPHEVKESRKQHVTHAKEKLQQKRSARESVLDGVRDATQILMMLKKVMR